MITKEQVEAAQNSWGAGVVKIGSLKDKRSECEDYASEFLDRLYAFDKGQVLFKPTKCSEQQFRPSKAEALSLVCPADNLEMPIRNEFGGTAFFYTALGVYFEFDVPTQYDLWELIERQHIERLLFISSVQSDFYKRAFDVQRQNVYPVDLELAKIRRRIFEPGILPGYGLPDYTLLASGHLATQKERVLSTEYLGYQLISHTIEVKAYLFLPQYTVFRSLEEMEWKTSLIHNISLN